METPDLDSLDPLPLGQVSLAWNAPGAVEVDTRVGKRTIGPKLLSVQAKAQAFTRASLQLSHFFGEETPQCQSTKGQA